jgi:dipeptidyl aminopeptidase/acylaminoacyl peptidase
MKPRTLFPFAISLLLACSTPQRTGTSTGSSHPPFTWHPRNGPTMDQLLNVHRTWAPASSPDGNRVAFLSDTSGLPQPYSFAIASEPAPEEAWQRLTTSTERIQFVAWSPDSRYLFFGRDHGGDENTQILRSSITGEGMLDLTSAPQFKHMFGALTDDGRQMAYASNARNNRDFDIYVRATTDGQGEPRRVLEAQGHHEAQDFSADGRQLAVIEEHSSFDTDLYLVDVTAGTGRNLTAHQGQGDIRYFNARFTRDGRSMYVLSDYGREYVNLAVMSTAPGSSGLVFVLEEPHDIDAMEFSRVSATLAVVVNVDGWSQLRLYDASNPVQLRELTRPTIPPGVITTLDFSHDGRYLLLDLSRASSPDEVYRVDVRSGAVERVTRSDHAGVDEATLVEPTVERVRSFDGVEVPVMLFRPRNMQPGERVPAVVWVHGGPEAQFTPYFSAVIQYLVGHGYIVAAPNVRGSTGYGKRYAHLDDVALREDSVKDLAAVNRWLQGRHDVAPGRVGITGGSYGGYMVLAALTLDPDLWAAGCDIVGIANFRTFLERTAAYRRALREAEYGSLAHDGELLDRISPIRRVDRIRAPLFVIHGANDPRVPVTEAEQIVQALRRRNQRVEYVRFENEGHGIFRRENKIRAYGELVRFFDEVLGGVTPAPSSGASATPAAPPAPTTPTS